MRGLWIGKAGRILVGGPAGIDDSGIDFNKCKDKIKGPTDVEPVFFHALPRSCDFEWHHSYDLIGVVSLATGPGNDALACVLARKPFFGICLTKNHVDLLTEWLTKQVWKAFITENSGLYESELAALVKETEHFDSTQEVDTAAASQAVPEMQVQDTEEATSQTKRRRTGSVTAAAPSAATDTSTKAPKKKAKMASAKAAASDATLTLSKDELIKKIKELSTPTSMPADDSALAEEPSDSVSE